MPYRPEKLGADCAHCPRRGSIPVPPEGKPGASVVWLGQDPGATEVKLGRPFVGPTGVRLAHIWEEAFTYNEQPTMPRSNIWVTNAALCAPITKNEKEARQAATCCNKRLRRELRNTSPSAGILTMGKWAYFALTGSDEGMGKYQGFHVVLTGKQWFMPVLHPAATFRTPDALGPLVAHVTQFVKRVLHGFDPEPKLELDPPAERLRWLHQECLRRRIGMAVDVETRPPRPGEQWTHLALLPGYAKLRAFGVGADIGWGIGMSWFYPCKSDVWAAFKAAMEDRRLVKVGANMVHYDMPILKRYGVEVR